MRRLLALWYVLLVMLALELVFYGFTGFIADSYRQLLWQRFNEGVKEFHEVGNEVPYAEIINRIARAEGVDGQLVAAVIKAESSFQPKALSSSGAYGLMQIIPATWQQINNEIKACTGRHAGNCTDNCFFNPELNIRIGTAYLSRLYKAHNGEMVLALAAYNAGPGEVSRYNGVPPFTETRNYIELIITYWYSAQNKPLPAYNLKAEYWQDIHSRLGWLSALTAAVIVVLIWRLLKNYRSWRWR